MNITKNYKQMDAKQGIIQRTVYYKSRSSDKTYKTIRDKEGKIFCYCPGFIYGRKCWHVERMAQMA